MAKGLTLSPPLRWRFTDDDDVAAYGDRWWTWDEAAVARLRGRELIAIEETIGKRLLDVLLELREEDTYAIMVALWVSMRLADHPVGWDDFNPVVLLVTWEAAPAAPLDSGEAPPRPASDSSPEPTAESATS